MATTHLNKDGSISEQSVHLVVMRWVRLQPKIAPYVLHIPNESKRSPRYGKLLKDMGMRKGVADLFIAIPRNGYHGAWIEIKTDKGRATPEQKIFLEDMKKMNYHGCITHGIDETIKAIEDYLS